MKPFCFWTVALFCAQPAAAQAFQNLSTPDYGSVLYFSSPDYLAGSGESLNSKIFRWDATNGFQLVADVPNPGTFDGCTYPNFYQLSSPQVSADGTILAYTASRQTTGGRYCSPVEPNQGVLAQNGIAKTFVGSIALSRNGRYAITTPMDAVTNNYHVVTDLLLGTSMTVSGAFDGDQRRITDEGAIVTPETSAILLTDRTGDTQIFPTKMQVDDVIINRAGTTLVYLTVLGPNNSGAISVINVSSGVETQIFTGFGPSDLSLTADGTTLLFMNSSNLYLIGTDGSDQRQVGTETVGGGAIISGDGTTIYADAMDGGLLRIDVASGTATELAPATPLITAVYRPYPPATTIAAVGSVLTLYGPEPEAVKQVTFCGQPVSLLHGNYLQFQVPFTLSNQTCQAVVQTASPFESAVTLTVQQYDPQFVAGGLVVHGDFSGPISSTSPAHPGEVIVTYMTGLGPVDQNGLLTKPGFFCDVESVAANVLYAGLAPGYLGTYQLNIQVPNVSDSAPSLTCGWDPLTEAVTSIWLGPN
jgi:uncharacterized protein (TIGR03437 family)